MATTQFLRLELQSQYSICKSVTFKFKYFSCFIKFSTTRHSLLDWKGFSASCIWSNHHYFLTNLTKTNCLLNIKFLVSMSRQISNFLTENARKMFTDSATLQTVYIICKIIYRRVFLMKSCVSLHQGYLENLFLKKESPVNSPALPWTGTQIFREFRTWVPF